MVVMMALAKARSCHFISRQVSIAADYRDTEEQRSTRRRYSSLNNLSSMLAVTSIFMAASLLMRKSSDETHPSEDYPVYIPASASANKFLERHSQSSQLCFFTTLNLILKRATTNMVENTISVKLVLVT